ncbi:MAG: SusE domain-containing protein [Lacibacter sp.]|nr:SusE domain-containing protein [Lacibacter sp.]
MKAIHYLLFFTSVATFVACEKQENKIYFEGGTNPQISSNTTTVRLQAGEEANAAIRFAWTNPDYKFTTGLSSHDVTYTIEIDTVGGNFASGAKIEIVVSKDLFRLFNVGDFNKLLTTGLSGGKGMGLKINPRRTYNLEARVTARIGAAVPLISNNKVTFTASPFPPPPKVPIPDAGTLWVTGSAFASNWSNPFGAGSPYLTSQRFTKLSDTDYELVVNMIPGGGYKLIQAQGDWGTQYSRKSGDALGGEFEKRDGTQFDAPSVAGSYKLKFDFQTGTFTVVKQ